jgi:hypothetical protein
VLFLREEEVLCRSRRHMSEDEAAELLLSQRAFCDWSLGWRIVEGGSDYRMATSEEGAVLEKVKEIIAGRGMESDYVSGSATPEVRDEQ